MSQESFEHYQVLEKERLTQGRIFMFAALGLLVFLSLALVAGPTEGWKWLLGALLCLFGSLLARIDQQAVTLLAQIHLVKHSR